MDAAEPSSPGRMLYMSDDEVDEANAHSSQHAMHTHDFTPQHALQENIEGDTTMKIDEVSSVIPSTPLKSPKSKVTPKRSGKAPRVKQETLKLQIGSQTDFSSNPGNVQRSSPSTPVTPHLYSQICDTSPFQPQSFGSNLPEPIIRSVQRASSPFRNSHNSRPSLVSMIPFSACSRASNPTKTTGGKVESSSYYMSSGLGLPYHSAAPVIESFGRSSQIQPISTSSFPFGSQCNSPYQPSFVPFGSTSISDQSMMSVRHQPASAGPWTSSFQHPYQTALRHSHHQPSQSHSGVYGFQAPISPQGGGRSAGLATFPSSLSGGNMSIGAHSGSLSNNHGVSNPQQGTTWSPRPESSGSSSKASLGGANCQTPASNESEDGSRRSSIGAGGKMGKVLSGAGS
ncbi:hypothetical protein BY996DRAFT_2144852 [Phakopsora pachyrhizi]|nr:hypothetical protein BY996DRAFT_2144852 [Phakopsora pachyrhizi]